MESAMRSGSNGGFSLKWTLAKKVSGLALVCFLVLAAVTIFMYRSVTRIGLEVSELSEIELPGVLLIDTIQTEQLQEHLALERILRRNPGKSESVARAVADFEEREKRVDAAIQAGIQAIEKAVRANPEYGSLPEKLALVDRAHRDFVGESRQLIVAFEAGKLDELERRSSETERIADELRAQMARLTSDVQSYASESAKTAESHEASAANAAAALGIAGAVLSILVSVIFIGSLRKSVSGLSGMAVRISEGSLQHEKLPVTTTDELGQLSLIFNDMLDNLRNNVSQSREGAVALGGAVAEILASTKEQAAGTSEQAAAVQETTATMEEISQSGAQVAERARQVAAAAEATASATNVGIDAVQATSKVMNSIQEQSETVAENIVALSEKTQAVGAIIATVNDIAEQSNLLALNAAIEAAAAGEHGRSFSVVASEIKNLANQAKDATGQVKSILGDIQKGIHTSVMATEEVVKRADSGRKQSDVAERTIHQLAQSLKDSIQAFQQITAATNQQQIGFDQVTQALKNIRQGSDQTAVSINQLEKAAVNLNALGQQLTKTVERYRL